MNELSERRRIPWLSEVWARERERSMKESAILEIRKRKKM